MNKHVPTDDELSAYLDGQLSPEMNSWVEDGLSQSPELRAQLELLREQDRTLRLAIQSLDYQLPPNSELDPSRIRRARQQKKQHFFALCASLFLCFILGNWSGWYTHERVLLAKEPPMADAMEAYRLIVLDSGILSNEHLSEGLNQVVVNRWFEQNFSMADFPPDLNRFGLIAKYFQLVPTADGPAALIVYDSGDGQKLMYFVRPPSKGLRKFLEHGEREENGLLANYWSDDHFNYALVCQSDFSQLPLVRKLPQKL